ncbi:hypothetical protein MNBD_GAMMA25-115 [hydrothermal vent metagenome]|uniref:Phosphate/phosphite/phosphonate ABC transporter substrate-binding protein n=1 Tax=hydrothermal vent metagenome TaxID=652676 RepID=A0A3B1BWP1_9ZZZZ
MKIMDIIGYVFLLLISKHLLASEPIIFSTAPTHSSEKTIEMYQPLLNYLSEEIGRPVIMKMAVNFTDYNIKMQHNKYDFLFDGPQFVNWRMLKFGHEPLVRLPGSIKIVIISKTSKNINAMKDLIGKRVCTFPSPNLLTMIFLDNFQNPMRQPIMVPARGFKGIEACLENPSSVAAVLRDKLWNKIKDKDGLMVLYAPAHAYPERTFSISKGIDLLTRQKIKNALLNNRGKEAAKNIFAVFKRKKFIESTEDEYKGAAKLLQPIWGYELR